MRIQCHNCVRLVRAYRLNFRENALLDILKMYLIRTNFRAFAQKKHLSAKISTEFTLKKAMRKI